MRERRFAAVGVISLLMLLAPPTDGGIYGNFWVYFDPFYILFQVLEGKFGQTSLKRPGSAPRAPMASTGPAPAIVPFAEGISNQSSAGSGVGYFRAADGSYVELDFGAGPPLTLLSPASAGAKVFAGGTAVANAAPALAGVGAQSQITALSAAFPNGAVAFAAIAANGSTVLISLTSASAATAVSIGQDVNSVLFADLNRDGNPDLVVGFDGGNAPGGIAVLAGRSDGTFGTPVVSGGGTRATRFAVLDLNHDGVPDIVTASLDQTVSVLVGRGDGSFGAPATYPVGGSGQAVALADFNGDGHPDIVSGTEVLAGNGDGTFRAGIPLPAVPGNLWAFAAGDLNGDGTMDIAYADILNQVDGVLFGNGDGTFRAGPAYAVSMLPDFIVLADFNHDGRLDIINGSGDQRAFGISDNSSNTDILVNLGGGTFEGARSYFPVPLPGNSTLMKGMAVAKFGGATGVVSLGYGGLKLLAGDGKGGLEAAQGISFPSAAQAVVAADFNGDGKPDLAIASGQSVAILPAAGAGFGGPIMSPAAASAIAAMTWGDFDGDNKTDLVVMSGGSPGSLAFLKGNGDGTFQMPKAIPAGVAPLSMIAVDLNGDGKPDVAFADAGSGVNGGVYVALNQGGGVFATPVQVFTGSSPALAAGDLNGDGRADLVVTSNAGGGGAVVNWLPGNGNGTFQAPIAIATSPDQDDAALVEDFNGDGHADIVLAHPNTDVTYFAGDGNGGFSAETHLLAPEQPAFLASGDLNGDGKPDLIAGGLSIAVLLNKGIPPVSTVNSASFTTGVAVGSIATAYGQDLATSTAAGATTLTLEDSTGTAQQCTLFYVAPLQVNFLIPANAAAGPATLTVESGDGTVSQGALLLTTTAPGLYAADGLAAALTVTVNAAGAQTTTVLVHADSTGALVTTPIQLGPTAGTVYLVLYGTGIRAAPLSQVSVQVAGESLKPVYAGPAPGFQGEDQVNVQLPDTLKGTGAAEVTVTVAGQQSNAVKIQIQ